jgi:hypothetical protein
MVIREGLVMDLLIRIKNNMLKITMVFFILSLSHCSSNDFDFNPWTTVGKKMLEYNETN